jgi:hypothetical protein
VENACYYTFSTVCQTLAGAFGFLVAVVLYRLQGIGQALDGAAYYLHTGRNFQQNDNLDRARKEGDWDGLEAMLRRSTINLGLTPEQRGDFERDAAKWYARNDHRKAILAQLKWALIWTALTIAGSLALLAFTPLIAKSCVAVVSSLLVAIVAAWRCLWWYYGLAVDTAEQGPGPNAGRDRVASGPAAPPYSSGETPVSDVIEILDPEIGNWTARAKGQRAWDLIEPLTWVRRDRHTIFKAVLDERGEILKLHPAAAELEGLEEGYRVVCARLAS